MSDHVMEWLNAYLDGELHGSRLHQVETHLDECNACHAELASLETLSAFLQEAPAAEFSPPEKFAAQVRLRLPRQKTAPVRNRILEVGWWMIPVALLAIWIFMNTSFFLYDMLSVADRIGWLTSVSDWMRFDAWSTADWSAALERIGVLKGNSLALAASAETFTRTSLPQIILQVSIALLYLSWIAIWWARHQRQGYGQPLEG
ncbi:MAG TPA: zf-HC2 domain-containing protein [Anaerolineales bacterium]|nr:zf-HC2 domain-containing protein [Anaerolineales bacterium]